MTAFGDAGNLRPDPYWRSLVSNTDRGPRSMRVERSCQTDQNRPRCAVVHVADPQGVIRVCTPGLRRARCSDTVRPVSARIAVIEDDDAISARIEDLLEGEGYRCVASTSAESGTEILERQQPDLLILDVVLGGHPSGWKLLDQLSRNTHTAGIPVIVCAADASALVSHQSVLREQGIRWLAKPFDVQDLRPGS